MNETELDKMKKIVCECLSANPSAGLKHFRIKAFATDTFLTGLHGGGDGVPLVTAPPSGGGDNGFEITPNCQ
jgi:hypothetical protein